MATEPKILQPPSRVGEVLVFEGEGRVEVEGSVCLTEGILEFLAVAPESGKEYESLLLLHCKPSHLHAAFLAIGARPGSIPEQFMGDARGTMEARDTRPQGHRFRVMVRQGDKEWLPVENWLIDRSTNQPPNALEWIFTGSFFGRYSDGTEVYIADEERLIVAVWYNSACLLNVAAKTESPYRGATFGYEVNTRAIPPVGTRVKVSFQRVLPASDNKIPEKNRGGLSSPNPL